MKTSTLKMFLILMVAVLTWTPATQAMDAQKELQTHQMVTGLNTVFMLQQGYGAIGQQFANDKNPSEAKRAAMFRRFASVSPSIVEPYIVNAIGSQLTLDDLQNINAFLLTTAGKQFSSYTIAAAESKAKGLPAPARPEISESERLATVEFLNSAAFQRYGQLFNNKEFSIALMRALVRLPAFADLNLKPEDL